MRRPGDEPAEREGGEGGERREGEGAADEAHHRLAAPEPREDREGVPDHRGGDRRERDPVAADREPDQPGGQRLGGVPEERGRRAARPEVLERVPSARVAVADGAQVDPVAPRDEQGDRDRAEQVAGEGCYCVLAEDARRLLSPDALPARHRA
ncbi:MAG: hypothetical protein AVDCRST_MAG30-4159 [uncultured Solirubrobacteraceae bacterium]|uniref:Uncharacterized protein n=1 Tax=uncultured Solirubrobacteraceae bacterium TaxID=1162706 RepID=A0A6J4U0P8_9ACTN|nr:MAG: hypothetical protein AVDCRST_MAG30-4159 [uncultured Solirubrobacteraceae bacterium]